MLDSFGLLMAYVVLVALHLLVLFYHHWHWLVKLGMVCCVSLFFYVTYLSIPDFFGWPTPHERPQKIQLVAVFIDAPRKIYLWGHDLEAGLDRRRPRAYELPYSERVHDALRGAQNKLKKGMPMIGELRTRTAPSPNGEGAVREFEPLDLILYDMPEGLIPEGKK